jgi:SLT domain-containing protein
MKSMMAGGNDAGLRVASSVNSAKGRTKSGFSDSMLESVKEHFFDPIENLGDVFSFSRIGIDNLANVINKMSSGRLGEFWDAFKKGWTSSTKDVSKSWVASFFNSIDRFSGGILGGAANMVINVAQAPVQMAQAAGNRIMQNTDWVAQEQGFAAAAQVAAGNAILGAEDLVAAGGQKISDTFSWLVSSTKGLLGFAEGGIVTSPGLAMVGEAGPEVIIPLDQIKQIAARGTMGSPVGSTMETSKNASIGSGSINIPLMRPRIEATAGSLIDGIGTEMMRRATAEAKTVAGSSVPTDYSRTTGVTTTTSYANMFDENGVLKTTDSPRTSMDPMPLQDIHQKIHQEIASTQPPSSTVSSKELAAVADDTDQMVDLLADVLKGINTLVSYMKPSPMSGEGGAAGASTRSKIKPASSPQYHQLSYGRMRDSAVKGVVNDGVS